MPSELIPAGRELISASELNNGRTRLVYQVIDNNDGRTQRACILFDKGVTRDDKAITQKIGVVLWSPVTKSYYVKSASGVSPLESWL